MSHLGDKQQFFMWLVPLLLNKIHNEGYECTIGDGYRDPRLHGEYGHDIGYGHPRSAHKRRLAIDINLFKDGQYLTETYSHRRFGEFWESLDPDCVWGGRWSDGNHYELRLYSRGIET